MMKYVLVAMVGFILAACSQPGTRILPTDIAQQPTQIASATPAVEATPTPRWLETELDNIDVGIWLPAGWQADTTNGITLLEHLSSIPSGIPVTGITAYIFVPELSTLVTTAEPSENIAHAALHQVTHSPDHIGSAMVGEAVGFVWDEHHAAYYLYSDEDDICGIVIAVALPTEQIVVANIAAPMSESHRLRDMLPQLLGDLRLNTHQFSDTFISSLPDPLVFPM